MAKFIGTVEEFHKCLGPLVRNKVNALTSKARKELKGRCEHCPRSSTPKELESAHVRGRERKTLIEEVLHPHLAKGFVRCEINSVISEIIELHNPIHSTFKFLCKPCHRKYDQKS